QRHSAQLFNAGATKAPEGLCMNDLTAELGLLKRQARDAQSVMGNIQHLVRKLVDVRASAHERPGGLVARCAAAHVLGHVQKSGPAEVAAKHFATDRQLDQMLVIKSAVSPASTTVATWAAELVTVVTQD